VNRASCTVSGISPAFTQEPPIQLQRAGLVRCERDGVRTIWSAESELVDDLCTLVQTRLKQRLQTQLAQLQSA
jgi:hypothetical protein